MPAQQKKKVGKKAAERKWKGKDWFSISAPDWLGGTGIADTPATDVKSIPGRVVEIPISELTHDQSKYYMRIRLQLEKPSEHLVKTRFHSFFCVNEYLMRMARKGLGKVDVFIDVDTKDNWRLQVSVIAILNRRGNSEIKKKVRELATEIMTTKARDLNHDEFVKAAMAGVFQMKVKKAGCKIYPIRFVEVCKIETLRRG